MSAVVSGVVSVVMSAVAVSSCSDPGAPSKTLPAALELVTDLTTTATVGTPAGNFMVRVKDAAGNPLSGIIVNFSVSLGGGRVNPVADTSEADGIASTALTVGNIPGQNQLTATVGGVDPVKSASVTGVVGPPFRIAITRTSLRYPVGDNSEFINASVRDSLGNNTGSAVTWTSRNPALLSITPGGGNNANVQVVSRPGQTYVVATTGGLSDSVQASVLDASSTPCTFAASPSTLSVGASLAVAPDGVVCIRSDAAGAEYALISHFGTPVTAIVNTEVTAAGIVAPALAVAESHVGQPEEVSARSSAHTVFERALRERERREMGVYVAGARAWSDSRSSALALVATAREGDVVTTNVNAFEFCTNPDGRAARVVAITNSAIILADTANPSGGFTEAEYRAFGIAMDTLVSPVDTTAFGSPTDIDGNGRVVILFTGAVNELTPRTSPGVVLGFFYSRDLLPRTSSAGSCPGSNVGEMFYILVPDTGSVLGDRRSKEYVESIVVSTIAHEYQHLINASRRLYVNRTPAATEELWLNEGLSHIAEELVFYRASNLTPRQNLDAAALQTGTPARAAFEMFQRGNFGRYQQYLAAPGLTSPIVDEDLLGTRGASWAFLRYVADRSGTTDGNLWYRIVNSRTTGIANLDDALEGAVPTALGLLHDWSVSVFADDNITGSDAVFQQPSWNFLTAMPEVGFAFGLAPIILRDGILSSVPLRAAGTGFLRFGVPQNQEALIRVTGFNGRPLPIGVRLLIVRTN
jgi:hypothetical protein